MHLEQKQIITILTSVAFFLLTIGILSAWNTPAVGYEVSIYASTPLLYWIGLAFGFTVTFLLLFLELNGVSVPRYMGYVKWILLGLCIISLTTLLIIRGYYGYNFNGDTGTHVGNLLSALTSGTVSVIYPNLYYHTLFLTLVTSGDLLYIIKITPVFFILMFILGIYLLSREVLPKKQMAAISVFIACSLPFGSVSNYTGCGPLPCYLPYMIVLLLFTPLTLCAVFRIVNNKDRKPFLILVLILLVSAIFYHILASVILLIFIFVLCGYIILQRKKYLNAFEIIPSLITIIAVTGIGWLFWITMMRYLRIPVSSVYNALFLEDAGTVYSAGLVDQTGMAFGGGMDFADVLNVLISQFGSTGILLLFIALSVPIVFFGSRKNDAYKNVIPFYLTILPLMGVAGLSLISSSSFQPGRIVMFVTIVGVMLSGVVLYELLQSFFNSKIKVKRILSVLTAIGLIFGIFVLGLHMYYPTIEVHSPLSYNTQAEVSGMEFYFSKGNLDYQYLGLPYAPLLSRFSLLIYGSSYIQNQEYPTYYGDIASETVDYHFGYDTKDSFSETVSSPSYLLIDERDVLYQENYDLWKKYRLQWISDDYTHLDYDSGLKKILDNHEMRWYLYS